ncbi:MAG: hypothetical protein KC416_04190, partial [Myxococcales bacterium]|nr:hypothetical protein [Myxococcales bacterium]
MTSKTTNDSAGFNPLARGFIGQCYEIYDQHRHDPIQWSYFLRAWCVFGLNENRQILKDPRTRRFATEMPAIEGRSHHLKMLLFMEPPDHTRQRAAAMAALDREVLADLAHHADAHAARLVAEFGENDF